MAIDNLHFGGAVPAPGALGLAMLAALMPRRRRVEGR
jgi:MYXO-CTERM domain-containing protein